jgi:hypothetical protein
MYDYRELSSNCERYAQPSLCYSTFPICRELPRNQKAGAQLFNLQSSNQQDSFEEAMDELDDFSRLPDGMARKRGAKYRSSFEPTLDNKERERGRGVDVMIGELRTFKAPHLEMCAR